MPSRRIKKVNELIRQELSDIIRQEIEWPEGCLVTVKKADTAADLEETKIGVSVLPTEKRDKILNLLKKNIYQIQQSLNHKLVMRVVPKLDFYIDKSEEKAQRINHLLDKVSKKR
ncbi:MAG: 30S ribosome-binding factor RbfA [Patescibacteria group bacterium]|nr:30S ribosome-binding factor RbfA [Patescibacteria group bacterium]